MEQSAFFTFAQQWGEQLQKHKNMLQMGRAMAKEAVEEDGLLVQVRPYYHIPWKNQYSQCEYLSREYLHISGDAAVIKDAYIRLSQSESVIAIQPDYKYQASALSLPNDNRIKKQWGLYNDGSYVYEGEDGQTIQAVSGVDCNVLAAWEKINSQKEVVVAMIDTGVDYQHEDLQYAIWTNEDEIAGNGIDDDHNGYVDDLHGWDFYNGDSGICKYSKNGKAVASDNDNHGTHCAGTIAATANNGVGIAGIASPLNVKIMPIKCLGGANGATSTSKLIKGFKYAMANGADIVNASWGGSLKNKDDYALKNVVERCGMLVVAAAGNTGTANDLQGCYPASFSGELSNVISVGALDADGTLSVFSNYGTNVDILAPGSGIISTSVGGYATMSGTSMAVPMVTAVAAMLYAHKDYLPPAVLKQALVDSCRPLATVDSSVVSHAGILDANLAMAQIDGLVQDDIPPTISELYAEYDGVIKVSASDEGVAGIACIMYQKGVQAKAYFQRGARGNLVDGNMVQVKKSGLYTFYVKDHGNLENIQRIYVTVDVTAPDISVKKKKKKIQLQWSEKNTVIVEARYAFGKHDKNYFLQGNGTLVACKRKKKIWKKIKGKYLTVYAKDRAGNEKCKIFRLKK